MPLDRDLLTRFHRVLVEEIRDTSPEYLSGEFTVAEIYQKLVPYGVHRARLGVEMNGDYEDALLRLLAGEGEFLRIQSDPARKRIKRELDSSNPNTGIYREFAAVGVRLNADRIPPEPPGPGKDRTSTEDPVGPSADPPSGPHLFELAIPGGEESGDASTGKARTAAGSSQAGKGRSQGGVREPDPAAALAPPAKAGEAPTGGGPDASGGAPGASLHPGSGTGHRPTSCPGCSRGLPDRDSLRFCPLCGVNVLVRECPACSEPLEWEWSFCVACGTAVDAD